MSEKVTSLTAAQRPTPTSDEIAADGPERPARKPAPQAANQQAPKQRAPKRQPSDQPARNQRGANRSAGSQAAPKAQRGAGAQLESQPRVVEIDPPRRGPANAQGGDAPRPGGQALRRAVDEPDIQPPGRQRPREAPPAKAPPARPVPDKAPVAKAPPPPPAAVLPSAERRAKRRRSRFGLVTFVLLWAIPTALVAFYYAAVAADQYVVETQFAVRGVESTPLSGLGALGLGALPGGNESSDSYVIADYIESVQIIDDIRRFEGVDVRQFFARPLVDFVHRIDPATPVAEFAETWRWRTNVEYNSITGNTTFEVYAFTPEDARRIGELVLAQSERVVNELSREARDALINTARAEVERTQQRLREASADVLAFRNEQQIVDPTQVATLEAEILSELEGSLAELRTRRRALLAQVSANSPAVRALDPQINALEAQINEQRRNIGAGAGESQVGNVASVVGQFTDLALSEEFARTAYTAALQALETAQADARKQERYLATFVAPRAPDVSVHPKPLLYTMVAAFWFLILWGVVVFVTRSVRDHAI